MVCYVEVHRGVCNVGGLKMPIGDSSVSDVAQTADQGNEAACEEIRQACLRGLATAQRIVNRANVLIANAPGDKAAVMSKFGADQTDAEALMQKLVTLANAHQAAGESAISF